MTTVFPLAVRFGMLYFVLVHGFDTVAQVTDICFQYDTNGCSVPFDLPFFFKTLFTPSCNRHDVCYSCGVDYNISKDHCDKAFQGDTSAACRSHYLNSPPTVGQTTSSHHQQIMSHRKTVLYLINKHYEKFQSVLSRSMVKYIELFQTMELDRFIIQYQDHVIVNWVQILANLLSQHNHMAYPTQQNKVLTNFFQDIIQPKRTVPCIDIKHKTRSKNSIDFLKFEQNVLSILEKIPAAIFKTKLNQLKNMLLQGDNSETKYCEKIRNDVDSSTMCAKFQERITCNEIKLLVCLFFSDVYYLAVELFGYSSYHNEAEFYCNESFVHKCLPAF
uniref:Phospholipase A2 domain-containing protein n=1 Tax=Arion vulgaris TaxID=1028688 RepID=A0A0B6YP89_9EUPU